MQQAIEGEASEVLGRERYERRGEGQAALPEEEPPAAARPLTPIALALPGAGVLRFRLASEALAEDRRFRIIYFMPADAVTMGQCAEWAEEG